jgi:2-keto-4-pentenoate hydratase
VRVSVGGSDETATYDTNILVKSQYGQFSVEDVLRHVRHVHRFVELVHYVITGPSLTENTP